jgi:hypothetical protein
MWDVVAEKVWDLQAVEEGLVCLVLQHSSGAYALIARCVDMSCVFVISLDSDRLKQLRFYSKCLCIRLEIGLCGWY